MKPEFKKVTYKKNDDFIGIRGENNSITVYYPESFDLHDEIKDTFDILNCIRLTKISNISDKNNNANSAVAEDRHYAPIMSYIWIINDYIKNGIYVNREIVRTNDIRGKIDWKKTIQQPPIVSESKIVFTNFYSTFKTRKDNVLVDIYKYCLKIATERVGWLFKMNSLNFNKLEPTEGQKKYYISVVVNELDNTFNDVKRDRLNHLKLILTDVGNNSGTTSFEYGTYNFDRVFEKMIDEIFDGLKDTRDYNPKGLWKLEAIDNVEFESKPLRPDTIMINGDATYIIDSKYYRYGITADRKDLPETQSIQKQITYAEDLSNRKKCKNVYNVFIMPFNKNLNKFKVNTNIFRIGKGYTSWHKYGHIFENVHTFLVDLRYVILNYSNGKSDELINELISEIAKYTPQSNAEKNSDKKLFKQFERFRKICEGGKILNKRLAANIDFERFVDIYNSIGAVIDKFIKDNNKKNK